MILGLILARGGSKRLPEKNKRLFAGRPLVAWSIIEGLASAWIDRVAVSSDDGDILEIALSYSVEAIRRPLHLARDDSPSYGAILHAMDLCGPAYDVVCLLEPTSPLRTRHDIDACCALLSDTVGAEAAISVDPGKTEPNAAVYVGKSDWLRRGGNFSDAKLF